MKYDEFEAGMLFGAGIVLAAIIAAIAIRHSFLILVS